MSIGRHSRPVAAAILGAGGLIGCFGVPIAAYAQEREPTVPPDPATLSEAERLLGLDRTDLSPTERDRARRALWAAYANDPAHLETLRNLDAPVTWTTSDTSTTRTRGEMVMDRLVREIETEMRVTARDMANIANVRLIDGLPGYKEIEASRIRKLVMRALEDIPLAELPGGAAVAAAISNLPGMADVDVAAKSYRELRRDLRRSGVELLDSKLGDFFREHRVESIALAVGGITALRYASPEVARVMDRMHPRVHLLRDTTAGGHLSADAALAWRDRHVFPDLDLRADARTSVGKVELRARINGTFSAEADRFARGYGEVGARVVGENTAVDLSARLDTNRRTHVELDTLYYERNLELFARARLFGDFGDGTAVGRAGGRVRAEIDLTKPVKIGGARGDFGIYVGAGADTDGKNNDVSAGVIFRLRF